MVSTRNTSLALTVVLFLLTGCGSSGMGDILGGGGSTNNVSEIRGTVDQVDTRDRSIVLTNVENYNSNLMSGGGNSVRVYFDDRTSVSYQGRTYRPEDLERGDQVSVRVDQSNGRLLAESMSVLYNAGSGTSSGSYGRTVSGTVRYVDTSRRTIEVDGGYNGGTTVVDYDTSTPVTYNGKRYRPEDLERGDEVQITVRNSGSRMIADSISVVRNANDSGYGGGGSYGTSTVRGTVRTLDTSRRTIEIEQASWSSNFTTNTGRTAIIQYDSSTTLEYQGRVQDVTGLERGDVIDVVLRDDGRTPYRAERIVVVRDVNSY
jgi:hypothetical protein